MPIELTGEQARQLRLRAQGLMDDGEAEFTVAGVVHDCFGLQAQDARLAPLGVRARGSRLTAADVEQARIEDRSIVRTWCMRGTRHYVTTEDLSWLLSLFGPLYVDRGQRRLTQLGLDEEASERAVAVIRDALANVGPPTRDEVADRLLDDGFEFDPDGQAPVHLVRRACLEGVAIEAATRDGQETYALLDDWVSLDPLLDREEALAELARRYVAANEPATPGDLYSWSGLYKRDVRTGWEAIEDELTEVEIAGELAWILSPLDDIELDAATTVKLLPMYDSYFLGHENRDLILPEAYADQVYPVGGIIRSTLLVDGLAAGTWTLDRSGPEATVRIEPFESPTPAVESGIETEVEDLGRFLDIDVRCRIEAE